MAMPTEGRPASEHEGGYTYTSNDGGSFDSLPLHCWRCSAVEVSKDDALGLCEACFEKLRETPE